jgi:hypothetical protein
VIWNRGLIEGNKFPSKQVKFDESNKLFAYNNKDGTGMVRRKLIM